MRSKIDNNVLYSETTKVLVSDINVEKPIYEMDLQANKNIYTINVVLGDEKVKTDSLKYIPIYIIKNNPEIIGVFEYNEERNTDNPIFFNRINDNYLQKYKI